MTVNASIVGATGYTGQELVAILLKHPDVRITGLYSTTDEPKPFSTLVPRFKNRIELPCRKLDVKEIAASSDAVFLALPHTQAMAVVPQLLKAGKKVIDLSADYRLKDTRVFHEYYHVAHTDKPHLAQAVYGLPELYRLKIKQAQLVANPGCYPTAAVLGLAPLLALESGIDSIIIDAKSGTTGAGKKAAQEFLFSEVGDDFRAYRVNVHQHMPEIEQELSKIAGKKTKVTFVPHLLPVKRGILETIYVHGDAQRKKSSEKLLDRYKKFYNKEPFVRIKEPGAFPSLKDVVLTNYCDIGVQATETGVIIIAAIDNLLKGASGQAVQNLNIMYGFPETRGLV